MKKFLLAGLTAALVFGCADSDSNSNNNANNGNGNGNGNDNLNRLEKALTAADLIQLNADETDAYVKALNTFTLNLSGKITKADQNTVMSAFSLHTALDMLYQGSVDNTKKELSEVLGLDADLEKQAKLGAGMRNLLRFDGQYQDAQMTIANRIFLDKNMSIKEAYAKVLLDKYHAPVEIVEFAKKVETAKNINEYVRVNTLEMIPEIVQPEDVEPLSIALVNAIALKAQWLDAFPDGNTRKDNFTAHDGSSVEKEFMADKRSIQYHQVAGQYEAVSLDYKNNKYQMLFVLPTESIDKVVFTADTFAELHKGLNQSQARRIDLKIPKVKIDSGRMELDDTLKAMGLTSMYKGGLNNISDSLRVHFVMQKAVIEWSEKETKAAAATIVGGVNSMPPGEEIKKFHLDKPFAYYLVHKASGAILFHGQYVK